MSYPMPNGLVDLGRERVEFVDSVGGLYFRAITLPKKGDTVEQHSHGHDHVTLVTGGAVRIWLNGQWSEDVYGFRAVLIKAHDRHTFQALADETGLACVHALNGKPYEVE